MSETIGVQLGFQNYDDSVPDSQIHHEEMDFAVLCDELGFGRMWVVEHHFNGYAMSPDNFVTLAHLAARTKRIKLGVGAAILPWNDPLRVAEKVVLLDLISNGRMLLGLGRGLARREYEGLRIQMSEARERFDEAAAMIMKSLETGVFEGSGPFYPQPRVELRPRPERTFRDRTFTVAASSPESIATAARIGGSMMSIVQGDSQALKKSLDTFRTLFREQHEGEPPLTVLTDATYCHADPAIAEERARKYIGQNFAKVVEHYDFAGAHFRDTKGYTSYADGADAIRAAGLGPAIEGYLATQLWGTPDQIIQKFRDRVAVIGPYTPNFQMTGGGVPYNEAQECAALIAEKVLPALEEIIADAVAKQG